jgi:hypothetical protein
MSLAASRAFLPARLAAFLARLKRQLFQVLRAKAAAEKQTGSTQQRNEPWSFQV